METEQEHNQRRSTAYDLDRTISLSDGIFAFALTLLVLSIGVPEIPHSASSAELWTSLKDRGYELTSYLISFAVIGGFWIRHHRFCGTLKAVDGRFQVFNLAYLATIAFIPYPTQVLGDFTNPAAFALYAGAIAISILVSFVLGEHASRAHLYRQMPSRAEQAERRIDGGSVAAAFILSIPVVLLSGVLWPGYLCWFVGANIHRIPRTGRLRKH
uniref:Unannotated protein n=1 Tax=freshwater metagenome TaxID=449393 RepID=A0A6J5ZM68_9ZZZZ